MANKKRKKNSMEQRRTQQLIFIVALLAVPIANWLLHWIYINGSAVLMAFQNKNGNFSFINFENIYKEFFVKGDVSGLVLGIRNTILTFLAQEFIAVPISLTVSYFIYKQVTGYKAFRIIFYLPHIISGIVFVTVYKQLFSQIGPVAALCEDLGIKLPADGLLYTKTTAVPLVIFYYIWISACGNILFYSAMSRIPPDLIEVGRLEGLSLLKEFIYIVMPLIWPIFTTTVILDFCGMLNAGGPVLLFGNKVIQEGGTWTLPYWFFHQVHGQNGVAGLGNYGLMSAVGLCLTAISVPITLTVRHFLEKSATSEF